MSLRKDAKALPFFRRFVHTFFIVARNSGDFFRLLFVVMSLDVYFSFDNAFLGGNYVFFLVCDTENSDEICSRGTFRKLPKFVGSSNENLDNKNI
jgi:hypothetical protein